MKGLNSLTNIDWYLRHVELLQLSVVYADEVNKTLHRVAMSTNCDQWKPRCLNISRELKCLRKAFRSGSNSFENSQNSSKIRMTINEISRAVRNFDRIFVWTFVREFEISKFIRQCGFEHSFENSLTFDLAKKFAHFCRKVAKCS